jgi:hypothetical protein
MPKPSSRPTDPAVEDRERGAFAGNVAQRTKRDLMGSTAQPRGPPARHEATPKAAHRLTMDEIAAVSASLAAALAEAITVEADAFSLAKFCRRHGISLQLYYKLAQQGLAPATFNVGTRVLVSKEAAARWRAEREAASAAEAGAGS